MPFWESCPERGESEGGKKKREPPLRTKEEGTVSDKRGDCQWSSCGIENAEMPV